MKTEKVGAESGAQPDLLREVPVKFRHNGFEHTVDRMAQAVLDDHPGSSLSAAYRAVAEELFNAREVAKHAPRPQADEIKSLWETLTAWRERAEKAEASLRQPK